MGHLQRLVHPEEGGDGADHHSGEIDGQLELAEFQNVVIDGAAIPDGVPDGLEVVVQDDDLPRLFGRLGAAAHGKTHVGPLQGGGVVHPVPRHAHHQAHLLAQADHAGLVCG